MQSSGFRSPEFVSIRVNWWLENDDFGADQTIISRFLSREGAHHRAVLIAAARRAESAFHQRGYESVRSDLSRATKAGMEAAARGRHPEMRSRRRKTQRSRRRRAGHLSPHVFRDARQLKLWRLFQKGSDRMGLGITGRTLEISCATALRDGLQTRTRRTERVRPGSIRSLGEIVSRG